MGHRGSAVNIRAQLANGIIPFVSRLNEAVYQQFFQDLTTVRVSMH
jgi:hypothetical protein